MSYRTFTRTWWKRNPKWPGGREPGAGPRHYMGRYPTEAEAQAVCKQWNECHDPGFLSLKMEYEEV